MENNKYKFILDDEGYIIGYYTTLGEYDYEGQMSQYPNADKGWTKFINGQFVEDMAKKAQVLDREAKQQEIIILRKQLTDTDYIWNVIKEGDRTEEYYADVIANRHTWRLRIRELEESL